jgi:hypothetical protein
MNVQYNGRTGRDYCCVGSKGTEKETDKEKKNMDAAYNM